MEPVPEGFDEYTAQVLFSLFQLVVLSLVLERGMFIAFDIKWWRDKIDSGAKAAITIGVAVVICFIHDFDIIARVTDSDKSETIIGIFLSGMIVAGGSAGAKRLMQDFLSLSRAARDQKKAEEQAQLKEAQAQQARAEADALEAKARLAAVPGQA